MLIDIRRFNCAVSNGLLLLSFIVLITMFLLSADLFANDVLIVQRRDGVAVRFEVEHARDATTHRKGLMERQHLAQRSGMFFDFHRTQRIRMWMKNTLISLDMVFVRSNGKVSSVIKNTEPHSLKSQGSTEAVRYVLELNAGITERFSIDSDSRLIWGQMQDND